jgi:hypothetical protein
LQTADLLSLASLGVAFVALAVACYAIYKGNRNSSVATLVAINEAFRQAWQRFLTAQDDGAKSYELAELMNLLEIACGTLNERSLAGVSHGIMAAYLKEVLALLIDNEYAKCEITKLLNGPTTFGNIHQYLNIERPSPLSVTIPKEWYHK